MRQVILSLFFRWTKWKTYASCLRSHRATVKGRIYPSLSNSRTYAFIQRLCTTGCLITYLSEFSNRTNRKYTHTNTHSHSHTHTMRKREIYYEELAHLIVEAEDSIIYHLQARNPKDLWSTSSLSPKDWELEDLMFLLLPRTVEIYYLSSSVRQRVNFPFPSVLVLFRPSPDCLPSLGRAIGFTVYWFKC